MKASMRTVPIERSEPSRSLGLRIGRVGPPADVWYVAVFDALRAKAEDAVIVLSLDDVATECWGFVLLRLRW